MTRSFWLVLLLGCPLLADEPWSFRPRTNPQPPAVRNANWARADLDRFVLARIEAAGLSPSEDADRFTLARRVSVDLTGLPPTPADLRRFIDAPGPDDAALAKFVDDRLNSSRFGERWARHWLDVVRYADSTGRSWNAPYNYAFRYRDYVIDAFNTDTPYDRFILEQLAGDLLPAESIEHTRRNLTATGLLALGAIDLTKGQSESFVLDRVDDQIDVTTRAFLGLTISCTRCHDHKYDPVTVRDYYALAGIFYSTETHGGVAWLGQLGRNMYVDPDRLIARPRKTGDTPTDRLKLAGVHAMGDYQDRWRSGERNILWDTHRDFCMGVMEGSARDCDVRIGGEPYDRDEAPPRGDLRIPGLPRLPAIPSDASGRLELARWIALPEHPLTARVFVNRVWLHLLGKPLVPTVDDFGSSGEPPTHPELLDHLATRFVEQGWSVKSLIRSIVLSRTYRQTSRSRPKGEAIDPQNALYWRADVRRLEVEPLRDSLLHAAGRLTFDRPDGIQIAGTGGKGRAGHVRSLLTIEAPYRTIYLPVIRSTLPEMFTTFDFPDPTQIQGRRYVTTVATQSLFLMNNALVLDCARLAASRVLENDSDDERVREAYLLLINREPSADERSEGLEFLRSLNPPQDERRPDEYRWTCLIQALMCSAEFRNVR